MKMLLFFLSASLPALFCFAFGLADILYLKYRIRTQTYRTDAVFVGYEMKKHKRGKYSWIYGYHPILEFTEDATTYRVQSRLYYHEERKWTPGETIPLFYNRDNPRRFHLAEERNGEGMSVIRCGLILLAIAAVISIFVRIFTDL